MSAWLLLLLAVLSARAEVFLVSPRGPILPGENEILVLLYREGHASDEAVPALGASVGTVEPGRGRVAPGLYSYRYLAPAEPGEQVTFTVGTAGGGLSRVTLPVGRFPEAGARAEPASARAGSGAAIELRFRGQVPVPEHARVTLSEGELLGLEREGDELVLRLRAAPERYPRVLLVGLRDAWRWGAPPSWSVVRLVGNPRVPIRTEPGARVTLKVGRRSYGPFLADERGEALATIEVWPGEETAAVHIEDPVGNTQDTTLNLLRDPRPVLAADLAPLAGGGALLHLAAVQASGAPWTGPPPRCRASPGGSVALVKAGPGSYRAELRPPPDAPYLDVKLSCSLSGQEALRLDVPGNSGVPARLQLRAYPEVLSADFPVAQVQAYLEDTSGERLSPEGIELAASAGSIELEGVRGRALRAEFNGARAGNGAVLRATYRFPPGDGPPASLQVAAGRYDPSSHRLQLLARLRNARLQPLEGQRIRLVLGEEERWVTTGPHGWASAWMPVPDEELVLLEAFAGGLADRLPFLPADPWPPLDPSAPDLSARLDIPITAGRVREVFITARPARLEAGPSATATVTVRLVDRQGSAVTDEDIELSATRGEVGPLRLRADGSYEAWYRPPPNLRSGTVRLTARSRDGNFAASTELRIVPRPLDRAVGLGLGGLTNLGALSSPLIELNGELRLPVFQQHVLLRLSAMHFWDQATLDGESGQEVRIRSALLPLTLALLVRQERGTRAAWVGGGLVAMPYRVEALYGALPAVRGSGLGGPGFSILGGVGERVGGGELGLELRYLQAGLDGGGVAYSGVVGGVAADLFYRVLF